MKLHAAQSSKTACDNRAQSSPATTNAADATAAIVVCLRACLLGGRPSPSPSHAEQRCNGPRLAAQSESENLRPLLWCIYFLLISSAALITQGPHADVSKVVKSQVSPSWG